MLVYDVTHRVAETNGYFRLDSFVHPAVGSWHRPPRQLDPHGGVLYTFINLQTEGAIGGKAFKIEEEVRYSPTG